MKKYLTLENLSVLLLLTINVAFAALYVLQNTITFHTDIARDFLLLEDMFYNKNISLIGPRSGGIPGVFHGPLWIYLNLPAYIIGKGDPVIVGWFWVLLFVASIILVYWVGKKLWNKEVGIMSALLVSVTTLSDIHNLFNPYGAVITFPLFLYFIGKYLETKKILQLVLALFTLGIIIQFQMAFGGPILILMIGYLIYDSIIKKNIKPLLALAVLIIPLSSFIVFELRNNFLQTHSVYNYITGVENAGKQSDPLMVTLANRGKFMLQDVPGMLTENTALLSIILIGAVFYSLYKNKKQPLTIFFLYLYIGYWVLTMFYKGVIWGYYFWPFLAGLAVILAASLQSLPRYARYLLFFVLYMVNFIPLLGTPWVKLSAKDSSLWGFYRDTAKKVYEQAPNEFGYYIYTTDQYGYSSRYAMNHMARTYPEKTAAPYQKKSTVYLLIDDPGDHKFTNHINWIKYDVKIDKPPVSQERLSKTYKIQRYNLTPEEILIESNPNMIQTLIFR